MLFKKSFSASASKKFKFVILDQFFLVSISSCSLPLSSEVPILQDSLVSYAKHLKWST